LSASSQLDEFSRRQAQYGKIQPGVPGTNLKMLSARTKKISLALGIATVLALALLPVFRFSGRNSDSARAPLLAFVAADATAVIFVDVEELRSSPLLPTLSSWAPHPAEDSDYTEFVADTGFNYERDLSQVFVRISSQGGRSSTLVLAEGKFDRQKIEAYLGRNSLPVKQGNLTIFHAPGKAGAKPTSLAFLSDRRIAIADSENLSQALSPHNPKSDRADWQVRFNRLAGSPIFAVVRQDPTLQNVVANQSPQLAAFIGQLPWVTLAAKPEGGILRVVAEGETVTETASTQLRDFLLGIQLLVEGGLNDAKLRQQMNPAERAAYLDLLKGTEIEKVTRGEVKSVRIVCSITPEFLEVAKLHTAVVPSAARDLPAAANGRRRTSRQIEPAQ
jgi:hypothetical protein